jgi:hypothetical protein
MMLIDDGDELPGTPDEGETQLVATLGTARLERIDEAIRKHVHTRWLKVARVVALAMKDGDFSPTDADAVRLHVRRVSGRRVSGGRDTLSEPLPGSLTHHRRAIA